MPADLKNPFGESCCDGGANGPKESARPCGCDYGMCPPHLCKEHLLKEKALRLAEALQNKGLSREAIASLLDLDDPSELS